MTGDRAPVDRYGARYFWLLLAALAAIVLVMSMTREAPHTTDITKSAPAAIEPVTPTQTTPAPSTKP